MITYYVALGVLGAAALYQAFQLRKLRADVALHLSHPQADPPALAAVATQAGVNTDELAVQRARVNRLVPGVDGLDKRVDVLEAAGPGASQADLRSLADTIDVQLQAVISQLDDLSNRVEELHPDA